MFLPDRSRRIEIPSPLIQILERVDGAVLSIIHRNDKNIKVIKGKWCKKAKIHFCVIGVELEAGGAD